VPQARSSGSRARSSAGAKRTAGGSGAKRSTGAKQSPGRGSSASAGDGAGGAQSSSSAHTGAADAHVEALAERIRKLNERIIDAGRGAGEVTLTSYEKALKTIASTLERGPGSSDVEWISNIATAQAKFIRDVTEAWTKAAREMLK
jgi:hypothetical protein